jgi:hypothetical protein
MIGMDRRWRLLLLSLLSAGWLFDGSAQAVEGHKVRFCNGYFALCDASTCQSTGRTITVNVTGGGTANFSEADCVCPLVYGRAVADLNGGDMSGSCRPPAADQVWSLYSTLDHIPQAINGWAQSGRAAQVVPQLCPKSLNLGHQSVNCWSFSCDSQRYISGVPVATCHCALGESFEGTAVPPHTSFWTNAGQGNPEFCTEQPAAVPFTR